MVVAVVVVLALFGWAAFGWHPWSPCRQPCTGDSCILVRGLIGSQKSRFFADPEVRKALAENNLRVEVMSIAPKI